MSEYLHHRDQGSAHHAECAVMEPRLLADAGGVFTLEGPGRGAWAKSELRDLDDEGERRRTRKEAAAADERASRCKRDREREQGNAEANKRASDVQDDGDTCRTEG